MNDNPPVFEKPNYWISISEGTPVGTPVITVTAIDPDLPENNNITYLIDELGNEGRLLFKHLLFHWVQVCSGEELLWKVHRQLWYKASKRA